eukprot:COSAG02_NODE_5403_length_4357_cov_3.183185_5_plen_52_part_00
MLTQPEFACSRPLDGSQFPYRLSHFEIAAPLYLLCAPSEQHTMDRAQIVQL